MVIVGEWSSEEDSVLRPMVEIGVQAGDGPVVLESFLVDTGADCTVFSARLLAKLALPPESLLIGGILQGLGGRSGSVVIAATLVFGTTDGRSGNVAGQYLASPEPTALDLSVLGWDVLASFDVVVSRRRNQVLLLIGKETYAITG
jgi:Aspartyl protease